MSLDQHTPRVIVVKQDVNEDLYCCAPDADAAEIIQSTLLRTGPVGLFTELAADFRIVKTLDDIECQVWQERATELKWDTLEFFSSYRDRIPGRDYGQNRWAIAPESIDWNQYDIVVSMDVCIPKRITERYPKTLWAYYIREIKAPSYQLSLQHPAVGQDVVFNHYFRMAPPKLPSHVVEFPYHLHRPGCFHRLFDIQQSSERRGVFVDHHTMVTMQAKWRTALQAFGPIASTIHEGDREVIPTSEKLARRTMDSDLRERLLNSKFFLITPGQRHVFGTALVEAIAAGCLAIGNPESLREHGFFFTSHTAARTVEEAIEKMQLLDSDPRRYRIELAHQRELVEYLCYIRPMKQLLVAWRTKVAIDK
ncbi:hypothetical protein [Novipirellula maiorica]|uniref:hypothetical protein n=1 Tax=Novipirellula maiorica TaxID=1265734 RepID=UPI001360B0B6|nr:hypothetical protein [Rhodopirellula maiorica]